jgi:hypothetical protein
LRTVLGAGGLIGPTCSRLDMPCRNRPEVDKGRIGEATALETCGIDRALPILNIVFGIRVGDGRND